MNVDLAAFGLIDDPQPPQNQEYWVWPEHWEAFELFRSCQSDWRYTMMGGVIGLDKTALLATMQMFQIPPEQQKERLHQVMLIAQGALEVLRKD